MCVIVCKCKGSDFAPLEVIEKCIQRNPDGFSIAWNHDGELKVYKTLNPTEAMAKYKELSETLDPIVTAMLFHARLATHGSKKVENCHCWTDGTIAFAHNGVLSIPNRDDMTDSETFFRDLFLPAAAGCGFEFAMRMAKAVIGGTNNKFAVLDKDGHVFFVTGVKPYEKIQFPGLRGKIYFSNTLWQPQNTFSSAIGFDPYKKAGKDDMAKPVGASAVPHVGPRKQIGPAAPVTISRVEKAAIEAPVGDLFEQRYNNLVHHG